MKSPPIRHEVYGNPHGPVVVVLGGISASRHVARNSVNTEPGWWDQVVGPGKAIDTQHFRIVGLDWVTEPTAVASEAAHGSGRATTVTTFDQARAVAAVLDSIGVPSARAIIGASYGGMVALAFAARSPERVQRIVVIGAAHQSDPMTTVLRAIQRRIVRLAEQAGSPEEGVALARALAMTTYRTPEEFVARFHNEPTVGENETTFPAEDYVIARGRQYAERTDAADFRTLTLSLDLHAVVPEEIRVPTTLIGVVEDRLVPIDRIRELHRRLGGWSRLVEISSLYGHDAFLNDADVVSPFIAETLNESAIPTPHELPGDPKAGHTRAALEKFLEEVNENVSI